MVGSLTGAVASQIVTEASKMVILKILVSASSPSWPYPPDS